jgi:hypothetical protein
VVSSGSIQEIHTTQRNHLRRPIHTGRVRVCRRDAVYQLLLGQRHRRADDITGVLDHAVRRNGEVGCLNRRSDIADRRRWIDRTARLCVGVAVKRRALFGRTACPNVMTLTGAEVLGLLNPM